MVDFDKIKPVGKNIAKQGPDWLSQITFGKAQVVCDKAEEEATIHNSTNEDHFEIQPVQKEISLHLTKTVQMYHGQSNRIQ